MGLVADSRFSLRGLQLGRRLAAWRGKIASDESADRQPFLQAPAAVVWLIVLLLGAHAARVFVFSRSGASWFYEYGFVPARYSRVYLEAHQINPGNLLERALPFVSYMFLHANFTHVAVNCVWLLAFGPIVARRFGTLPFFLFFFLCGIAGAGVHLALNWGSDAPVVGASAAVSGLMAAGFRMIAPTSPRRRIADILSPQIMLWSAIWAAVNVVAGLTGLGAGRLEVVAWQAHIGGYAAGLFLAGPFDFLARRRVPVRLPT
jgi:membrane associated rhomboid family serine protease